jgi:hypothetical protein
MVNSAKGIELTKIQLKSRLNRFKMQTKFIEYEMIKVFGNGFNRKAA